MVRVDGVEHRLPGQAEEPVHAGVRVVGQYRIWRVVLVDSDSDSKLEHGVVARLHVGTVDGPTMPAALDLGSSRAFSSLIRAFE